MNMNTTRDVKNKRIDEDTRGLKQCCCHHMFAEYKRSDYFRPGYLGLCKRRKYMSN